MTECGLRQLHCGSDLYGKSRTYRLENRERKKEGEKRKREEKEKKEKKKKERKKE